MTDTTAIAAEQSFPAYLQSLWPDASKSGVSRNTFDGALMGLTPDPDVIRLTQHQPEYNRPIGAYLGSAVSATRISQGSKLSRTWDATLLRIEQEFGVDAKTVMSIWGIETGYGSVPARKNVFRSLATLAHSHYRGTFFRDELISALLIAENGHIAPEKMQGSWAGAMGQAQFIPSSFLKYAIDFSNDGRRDIWSNVPDVLGSIANYLSESGWIRGLRWGYEVILPAGFDYRRSRASFPEWKALKVRRADGGDFPNQHDAVLLFPSGHKGPAFLVTQNYLAIKAYNNSDAYALAVAHLADRMRNGPALVARWPEETPLSRNDRIAVQKRLAELGYKVTNFVGQIDFELRDQIRDVQAKAGWLPDGHPTAAFLAHIRAMEVARP